MFTKNKYVSRIVISKSTGHRTKIRHREYCNGTIDIVKEVYECEKRLYVRCNMQSEDFAKEMYQRRGKKKVKVHLRGERLAAGTKRGIRTEDGIFLVFDTDHEVTCGNCITGWKSQGSEHKHVIIVLDRNPRPWISRNLFYTMVTRASKSVHIFVDQSADVIERIVERNDPKIRHTFLREMLEQRMPSPEKVQEWIDKRAAAQSDNTREETEDGEDIEWCED